MGHYEMEHRRWCMGRVNTSKCCSRYREFTMVHPTTISIGGAYGTNVYNKCTKTVSNHDLPKSCQFQVIHSSLLRLHASKCSSSSFNGLQTRLAAMYSCLVAVDDINKRRLQASATDQEAVDVGLLGQLARVLLSHAATVQNAGLLSSLG